MSLLDLPTGVGQIAMSFSFDVYVEGKVAGRLALHPEASAAKMANNPGSNITRQLTGVVIDPTQWADINPFTDRIRPHLLLEDGTKAPLGEFLFVDSEQIQATVAQPVEVTLYDQTWLLAQPRRYPYGYRRGENMLEFLPILIEEIGVGPDEYEIIFDPDKIIRDPVSWPQGTPRQRIISEVCELAGYHPPYFDNSGVLQIRPVVSAEINSDTLRYRRSQIFVDSYVRTPNLLNAPNVYIVVNNGSIEGVVASRYEVPAEFPHSVAQRGFEVVEVIQTQGVDNSGDAEKIAQSRAVQDPANYEAATFTGPPDPRHDTFDTVLLDEEIYIELSWALDMSPGGAMTHQLRKSLDAGEN